MADGGDGGRNLITGAFLNTYNGKLSIQFTGSVDADDLFNVSINESICSKSIFRYLESRHHKDTSNILFYFHVSL